MCRKSIIAWCVLGVFCATSVALALPVPSAEQQRSTATITSGQEDLQAARYVAFQYYKGQGVRRDYNQAAALFRKTADRGDAYSQRMLGVLYSQGKGVKKDLAEAVKWYRKASEQGDRLGQSFLGHAYYRGRGVSRDYAEAATWLGKAAEQGDGYSQFVLGVMYSTGRGVPQDPSKAAKWLGEAAAQKYPPLINTVNVIGLMAGVLYCAALVGAAWYFRCKKRKCSFAEGLGFARPSAKTLATSIGVALLCVLYACFASIVLVGPHKQQSHSGLFLFDSGGFWAAVALLFLPFIAFAEEAFFRGFLLPAITKKWGVDAALIVVTLAFGLLHLRPWRPTVLLIAITLNGLIFGVQRIVTRSTTPSFITHAVYNEILFLAYVIAQIHLGHA